MIGLGLLLGLGLELGLEFRVRFFVFIAKCLSTRKVNQASSNI